MEDFLASFFLFFLASPCLSAPLTNLDANSSFNVLSYGAKGDGLTDDSQAFLEAWNDTCGATLSTPTLFIPNGKTFFLQPLLFQGPCKPSNISVMLQGNIAAPPTVDGWKWPDDNNKDKWIGFFGVNGLVIDGGGQIDGQGAPWWNCSNCSRPTALHFDGCQNLQLSNLTHINSPKNHVSISSCNGTRISNLHMIAPGDSPNTDGIDVSRSSDVVISNSTITTGDDCIAINSGSSFINITGVQCGPGHGISVGSLGINESFQTVEEVHVRNCTFTQSLNGARIKTWEGGSGYARKITFENIILNATQNPVIIDQHYNFELLDLDTNAVQVSDVTFIDIQGTSSSEIAINLNCDTNLHCTNITLDNINITSSVVGMNTSASCSNANVTSSLTFPVITCQKKIV